MAHDLWCPAGNGRLRWSRRWVPRLAAALWARCGPGAVMTGCLRDMRGISGPRRPLLVLGLGLGRWLGFLDLPEGGLLGAGQAPAVDAEQDPDAVAAPFGDAGGFDSGVQPGGQAGVPQVVGSLAER